MPIFRPIIPPNPALIHYGHVSIPYTYLISDLENDPFFINPTLDHNLPLTDLDYK